MKKIILLLFLLVAIIVAGCVTDGPDKNRGQKSSSKHSRSHVGCH